ncbi:unnamed protein product [Bursaphelenchus okinawaensis]|uniref:Uncharacterized protein n=1 Tax=Bursaphelenchus okinawaensis TaxID=465554 RepID=A0A811LGJ2_9BILA|nr:unnamed protein product [Bursaphelenchus okinawaensis]CAG9122004.1 unnamed protein product [Bursaphelenchus okinawaensis]
MSSEAGSSAVAFSSDVSKDKKEVTPTKILSIAIRKRRELLEEKDVDLRREIQHKSMIQTLCKELGDARAKKRRTRRKSKKGKKDDQYEQLFEYESEEDAVSTSKSGQTSQGAEDTQYTGYFSKFESYSHKTEDYVEYAYTYSQASSGYDSGYSSPSCSKEDWDALGIHQDDQCVQVNNYSYSSFSDHQTSTAVHQALSGINGVSGFKENDDPYSGYSAFWEPSTSSESSSSASWDNTNCNFSYPTDFSALKPVENDGYQHSNDLTPLKPMKRPSRWDAECAVEAKQSRLELLQEPQFVGMGRFAQCCY